MSKLIKPSDALEVVTLELDLSNMRPSNYLLARSLGMPDGESPLAWLYSNLVGSGKSGYLANKDLDHNLGKTAFTMPSVVALALCTTVPTSSSTGATLVEASYTGYAEKKIEAASLNAASSGKTTNSATIEFAACTGGSSTIVGFAIKDSSTVGSGNILYWGTLTSTVISTSATPVTFEPGHIEATEA